MCLLFSHLLLQHPGPRSGDLASSNQYPDFVRLEVSDFLADCAMCNSTFSMSMSKHSMFSLRSGEIVAILGNKFFSKLLHPSLDSTVLNLKFKKTWFLKGNIASSKGYT